MQGEWLLSKTNMSNLLLAKIHNIKVCTGHAWSSHLEQNSKFSSQLINCCDQKKPQNPGGSLWNWLLYPNWSTQPLLKVERRLELMVFSKSVKKVLSSFPGLCKAVDWDARWNKLSIISSWFQIQQSALLKVYFLTYFPEWTGMMTNQPWTLNHRLLQKLENCSICTPGDQAGGLVGSGHDWFQLDFDHCYNHHHLIYFFPQGEQELHFP